MSCNDDDDLGEAFTSRFLDGSGLARRLVEEWRLTAMGNRPSDHMARDLLISSLLRDSRQWLFKKLVATPPPWIGRHTIGIRPERLRTLACQVCAFHFVHAMRLYRLSEEANEQHHPIIKRLLGCWPVGAQVSWDGPGKRDSKHICRRARLCPFCFARAVTDLYERIQPTLLSDPAEGVFILAKLNISDDLFSTTDELPLRERCEFVRHRVGQALVEQFKRLGATGGVTTFLVGPKLLRPWREYGITAEPEEGFEFKLSVLGRFIRFTPELEQLAAGESPLLEEFDDVGDEALDVEYRILGCQQALRFMVFGSSIGYSNGAGLENIVGAFSWPSWNLASYQQWSAHYEATQGMHLYDCFGDWVRGSSTGSIANCEHSGRAASGSKRTICGSLAVTDEWPTQAHQQRLNCIDA